MNKYQKIIFGVSFALILVIICVSIVVYWMTFGGGLSTDSNDWIVFATLVGSIGTMLFTGLNVLVFYMLKAYKLHRKANDLIVKMFDDMVDIPS